MYWLNKNFLTKCICGFVVVLWFYGPVNLSRASRAVQLTYSHYSWAGLDLLSYQPVLSAHTFVNNWQLPFWNQRTGKNGRRKYFMINLHGSFVAGLGFGIATLGSVVRRVADCAMEPGICGSNC